MKNIIDLWMKYTYNYNLVVIGDIYAPEILTSTHCPEHLADKWYSLTERPNNSGTTALLQLWHELDGENQERFTEWLQENYKG